MFLTGEVEAGCWRSWGCATMGHKCRPSLTRRCSDPFTCPTTQVVEPIICRQGPSLCHHSACGQRALIGRFGHFRRAALRCAPKPPIRINYLRCAAQRRIQSGCSHQCYTSSDSSLSAVSASMWSLSQDTDGMCCAGSKVLAQLPCDSRLPNKVAPLTL